MAKEASETVADEPNVAPESASEATKEAARQGGPKRTPASAGAKRESPRRRRRAPWHVSVARALGLASGWAAGGIDRASKAMPRRPRGDIQPLLQALGELVGQHSESYEKLRDEPNFWELIGSLERHRPRSNPRRNRRQARRPAQTIHKKAATRDGTTGAPPTASATPADPTSVAAEEEE